MARYSILAEDYSVATDYQPRYDTSMVRRGEEWGTPGVGWVPVEMPDLLAGSDYMGGSVTASNHRLFMEEYGDVPGVWEYSGSYGGYGVLLTPWALAWVVSGDPVEEYGVDSDPYARAGRRSIRTIRDILAELEESYPCIDDDDVSLVELEAEDEAWESWARRDAERALLARFPGLPEDFWDSQELLRRDFEVWADTAGVYWRNETGNSAWIDVERVIAGADLTIVTDYSGGLEE